MKGVAKKAFALFLTLVLSAAVLTGCFSEEPVEFSNSGMTVTLTSAFKEVEHEGFTAAYDSRDIAVFAIKEMISDLPGGASLTLEDYGKLVLETNGLDTTLSKEGLLTYFVFEKDIDGAKYSYFSSVYKGSDAFWLFQFACKSSSFDGLKDDVISYASSVEV